MGLELALLGLTLAGTAAFAQDTPPPPPSAKEWTVPGALPEKPSPYFHKAPTSPNLAPMPIDPPPLPKTTPQTPVPTDRPLRQLGRVQGPVLTLAISPDGRTLASGGADQVIHLWEPAPMAPNDPMPRYVLKLRPL